MVNPRRLQLVQQAADELIALAEEMGVIVRINPVPLRPLSMGNKKMVATVEPKFIREE